MKPLRTSSYVAGLLLVTLCSTAAVFVWAGNRQNNHTARLENKTRSLNVESVQDMGGAQGGSRFAVTVRNVHHKPIVAYSIRVEDGSTPGGDISTVESSGLVDDWVLAPNATDTAQVSASSAGDVVLTVYAIMFEDGSGDGDKDELKRMQEVRVGVKLAYQRIVPLLRRAAGEKKKGAEAAQSLDDEVGAISDQGVPMNSMRGFVQAKDYVRSELQQLKAKIKSEPDAYGEEVEKRAKAVEKALARL